jgi:dimeric dUTPase (all-alpha-NTP-PPase superfamily)
MNTQEMFETMLKKQEELNSDIMKEFGLTTISKEQIDMATLDEIGEFTHELKGDWCWWKKSQEPVNRNKALEELADIFHFVLIYELFYGKRKYLTDPEQYRESPRDYMPMVQMDIGFGIATALTRIIDLADSRLMYLLALSEHLGFSLEEIYAAYMRKNAINMERLKNGY